MNEQVARLRAWARDHQLLVCAGWLTLIAAAVYGPHVLHGGFAWDDWLNGASTLVPGAEGTLGPFYLRAMAYEPGLALTLPLPFLLFGAHAAWHLALAALLGVALSVSIYVLGREIGLRALPALAVATLSLVFPWADSVRLWATAGINQLAAIAYVVGLILALRSLAAADGQARRLTRWSLALYAASILTYAVATIPIACSTLLYRTKTSWHEAWRRGRWDLLLALAGSLYVGLLTTKPVEPIGGQIAHAGHIFDGWLGLLGHAIVPLPGLGFARTIGLALLAALAIVAVASPARRRWALYGLGGAGAALVTYAVFASGEPKYVPLAPGLYNRVGMMAAPALSLTVFAVAALVAGLVLRGRRLTAARAFATYALVAVIAFGWAAGVRRDARQWDRAAAESRSTLAMLKRAMPRPAHGTIVYVVGQKSYVHDGVPVFASSFDLDNAYTMALGARGVHAFPVSSPLVCGRTRVAPAMWPYRTRWRARYADPWVVDAKTGIATRITSRSSCLHVAEASGLGRPRHGLTVAGGRWQD